jgi:pimeloyl-ACP methyl ester carboxylesterase
MREGDPRGVRRGQRAIRPGRSLALGAVLVVIAGLAPASAFAVAAPKLSWKPCADRAQKGFQCATARGVPLDYRHPRGRTISLAVIRHGASNPAHRIGTLFFNPGGPGGAGTALLPSVISVFPAAVQARFDIVSWDPRGVGQSTRVECFASAKAESDFLGGMVIGSSFPVGRAEMSAWIGRYRAFDRHCQRRGGSLLRHVSTADTARDLDLLRRAVGDRQLSYYGVSYGTFLGATYANLFPARVRAMVLDGNLDPSAYVRPEIRANGGRFLTTDLREHADLSAANTLNAFLELCGSADTTQCAFSAGSPATTRAKFAALLRRLRSRPQSADMSYAQVVSTTGNALYSPPAWPSLANTLQDLWTTGTAKPVTSTAPAFGQIFAIRCSESPNPGSAAFRSVDAFAYVRSGPLGPWWSWQSLACGSWRVTAADRYAGPWDRRTANPVLVMNTTHDPSSPYQSAVAMARELARARLLTVDGYGHGVGGSSACASRYMSRYLIDKALPPARTRCKQDQVPFQGKPWRFRTQQADT